jgi:zinc D-Ala-D-Ala carboxypeptidase
MTKIDWSLYPNFSESEFRCKHTGKCEMDPAFLATLQAIRTEFGKPLGVSSGYRDRSHPIEAKKSATGAHAMGIAVDFRVYGADALRLIEIALKHGIQRIGVNQKGGARFIHLDAGGPGLPSPAIWSY